MNHLSKRVYDWQNLNDVESIKNRLQILNARANDIMYKNAIMSMNLMYDAIKKMRYSKFFSNYLINIRNKSFSSSMHTQTNILIAKSC